MKNKKLMKSIKQLCVLVIFSISATAVGQRDSIAQQREARKLLRNGNELYSKEQYADASALYKKALDKSATYKKASYNLGNSLYLQKDYKAAVPQYELSAKTGKDKLSKASAYHNIGNAMMQQKQYQQAIDAYENALRNNPTDDETRYNLAVAKEKLKKQQNKDNKDKKNNDKNKNKKNNKDKKDDKGQKKKDPNSDKKDKDKEGKKNDQDKDQNKKDPSNQNQKKDSKQQPKPQQGKMSPEQIKQLLKSLNNEEKKTQKKMNAQKAKGTKTKNGKDW